MSSSANLDGDLTDSEDEGIIMDVLMVPQALRLSDVAFRDPLRPRFCAKLLHGVWYGMLFSEDTSTIPAAFNFIVARRTDAQLKSMVEGLSHCQCGPLDPDDDLFHGFGEEALEEERARHHGEVSTAPTHFRMLMILISIRILRILETVNPIKLVKFRGRNAKWPASLDDIIPPSLGPESTVKSLEQWVSYISVSHLWAIELLGAIASTCRSLVFPAIMQSPTLIPTILRIAAGACAEATNNLLPHSSKRKLTETATRLFGRLGSINSFFRAISGPSGSPDMLDKFPIQWKTVIVQMCNRVVQILRSPLMVQYGPGERRVDLIKSYTANLTLFIDESVSMDGIDPSLIQHAIDQLERLHGPPLTILHILLLGWKKSLRCFAMNCDNSLHTASHKFQRCGSCKIVSYCGKECQKRAWPEHKSICKTLSRAVRDGGGDIESDDFGENCKAGKVDAGDAEQIVNAFSTWRRTHGGVSL
ncbi:MYND finger domain-containing protein [Favolaschia claudopus]|uniref:MYND finger domain-containing protein n=1 Tax=Favolaschia claudopus TaxID=2862362 RepID=A0AAW0ABF5_9AGAR